MREKTRATLLVPVLLSLAVLLFCRADGPSAFWRHVPIGAGRVDVEFDGPNALRKKLYETRRSVVREADGVESSVALLRRNELSLLVNGKSDGSSRSDAPTMAMSGLIGTALHPDPRRALVVGLGTGSTAGWMSQVPSMEWIDVVELEPAVIDFARAFDPIHFAVLDRPNVSLLEGDGREYVLTTNQRYDVIFSQPSNPYRAGVADLFSQDFYRAISKRLTEGGIFLQWLQGYEVDANVVEISYATLANAFPHVETWHINVSDLLLVASNEPVEHDLARLRERMAQEPYVSALRQVWRVEGAEGFYSAYVGGDGLARALAEPVGDAISTDDRPRIEFGFARSVGRKGLFAVEQLQDLARRLGVDRPDLHGGTLDPELVREARQIREIAQSFTESRPEDLSDAERIRRKARKAWAADDLAKARELWFSQDGAPREPLDRLLVAEVLAESAAEEAATVDAATVDATAALEAIRAEAPSEALFVQARLEWRRGDKTVAVADLVAAFESMRENPWCFRPLAQRGFQLLSEVVAADPRWSIPLLGALSRPFAVDLFEEARLVTRVNLAGRAGFAAHCVPVFEDFEPWVAWEESFLSARARCYETNRHPLAGEAARDHARYVDAAAPRLSAAVR